MINKFDSDLEILSIVEEEYHLIGRRYMERYLKKYDKIRRKNKIDKEAHFPMCFTFRAPSKNNWMCIISKAVSEKVYKDEDSSVIAFFCYYDDDYGIRVFHPTLFFRTSIYNSSFFYSYEEKMNLNYPDQLEVAKHYLTRNRNTYLHYQPESGRIDVIGLVRDGFLSGEWIPEVEIIIYNDFITKDMAGIIPDERKDMVVRQLERDILIQLDNKDNFLDGYLFLAELMTSLNHIDGFNTKKEIRV